MSTRYFITLLLFSTIHFSSSSNGVYSNNDVHPNVLILIADDLGYSDVSCFGNELIKTPNIDKLAENGIKLTRMYSMPSDEGSMAAIQTGRQPLRIGLVKGILGWPSFWSVAQNGGIPQMEMTMAKFYGMRKNSAFFFGRWDLGSWFESLPTSQGFGGFYGTVMGHSPGCSSDIDDLLTDWDYFWMIVKHNAPLFIAICILIFTAKILSYISLKSVILFVTIICIMLLVLRVYCWLLPLNSNTCQVLENQVVQKHAYNDTNLTQKTTEKVIHYLTFRRMFPFLLMTSYHQPGHPAFASQSFKGKSGINKYYDSILELDWSVGKIMDTLKQQGIENDTIVFFLSDNGPVKTHPYTGSPVKHSSVMRTLYGEKYSLTEGGLRIPAIVSWPNHFPSNQETAVVTSLMDIFPTLSDLSGTPTKLQKVHMKSFDGKSLLPLFQNLNRPNPSDYVHKSLLHYCEGGYVSAATVGDYKVYFVTHNITNDCSGNILDIPIVYNIVEDPGETTPLIAKQHQDVISKARSTAVRFEMSMEIQAKDIVCQFDQIPLPWHMWVSN